MSKHIITKSKMIVVGYVDAAGIGRRLFYLTRGGLLVYLNCKEKSAEVIVVADTSLCLKGTTREVSQSIEGPNIKLLANAVRRRASLIVSASRETEK